MSRERVPIGGLRHQSGQLPVAEDDHIRDVGRSSMFRTPAFLGERPFLCQVCGKRLALKIAGQTYELALFCTRCKCVITVRVPGDLWPSAGVQAAMIMHAGGADDGG